MTTETHSNGRSGNQAHARVTLRPSDVAVELDVCVRTVERLITRGDLPAIRVGRQLRVLRVELDAFLDASRVAG